MRCERSFPFYDMSTSWSTFPTSEPVAMGISMMLPCMVGSASSKSLASQSTSSKSASAA